MAASRQNGTFRNTPFLRLEPPLPHLPALPQPSQPPAAPMKQKKGTGSDALIPSPTLFVFGTFLLVFSVIEYIVTAALF